MMDRFIVQSLLAKARGRLARLAVLIGLVTGIATPASADLMYTLGLNSNGNAATADFKFVTGGIEISVTNTETDTDFVSTNAISQIQITIDPSKIGLATDFTRLSGNQISYSGPGAGTDLGFKDFTPPSTDPNLHWAFSTGGTTLVNLFNVGVGGVGGKPMEMIAPLNGVAQNNGVDNFVPYFNGTANFFLAVPNLPGILDKTVITGVSFSFGTGPDQSLAPGTGSGFSAPAVVPEPGTLGMILMGTGVTTGYGLVRRRRAKKVIATA